jgi:hypothetical protein
MSFEFNPNGHLNLAADATDLPDDGLVRCKNLRVDAAGKLKTRDGSLKVNATAINTAIWLLVEQSGNRYAFAGNAIYKNETSIATGMAFAQWSAIKYNAFNDTTQQIYALNGTDRKRIQDSTVYEWGIEPPSAPTVVSAGALTGLTGVYMAKITYCRKVGSTVVSESNPSDASSASGALANQSLLLSWAASSDPQVTHVRLYRTTAGGSTYLHDQDVAAGTNGIDTNTADSALGSEVESNHDRPPLGAVVIGPSYNGICFILKDNLLYFCSSKRPEYWPTSNFIEVSTTQFPLKAGTFSNGQLYCASKNEIFFVQGTSASSFFPYPMKAKTGAQNVFGMITVQGKGIYHTGPDGVYLFSGSDLKITEQTLEPIFRGETVNGVRGVSDNLANSWLYSAGNYVYLGYTSSGNTYPTNVLAINMDTNKVAYYIYNDGSDIEIRCITKDETNNRTLIGGNDGYIREIEKPGLTQDETTDISWECESKEFTLATRKHFPRWNKYDADVQSGTCNGHLILDGSAHQTHTITGSRNVRKRLVKEGNGSRASIRFSGSGVSTIYGAESE